MSRWFRMYDELLDDPKVQTLSGDEFKGWINLLCLAARHKGLLPSSEDIAFALRRSPNDAITLIERLLNAGLIDKRNGGTNGCHYAPHGWEQRQYKSDTSTDRVKRYRQRSRPVAGAVTVTPPDTDTDTDIPLDKSNGANPDSDREFWDNAKTYLKTHIKGDPGGFLGKCVKEQGKEKTANAITAAQLERAVDPVAYIQGYFRNHGKAFRSGYGPNHSGVPL